MGQVTVEDYLAVRPLLTAWAAHYAITEDDAAPSGAGATSVRSSKGDHTRERSAAENSTTESNGAESSATRQCINDSYPATTPAPNLAAEITAALAWCTPEMTRAYAALPRLWIHGDAHCSNMMYAGKDVCAVFDFGLSAVSTAVADLAIALERNTLLWLEILDSKPDAYRMDTARAILRGYQSLRPLNSTEAALLPHIMRAVHVDPALDWIPYHLISGRPSNAEWALETFFRGHTAWFTTDGGRRYLDELAASIEVSAPT